LNLNSKMEILENKENFLLNRKEIKIIVEAEKTPSCDEAINIVAEKFKVDKDLIVINQVKGEFGSRKFLINSFIYKSKEDKEKYEGKKKKEEKSENKEGSQEGTQEESPQAQTSQPEEEKREKEEKKEEVKEKAKEENK